MTPEEREKLVEEMAQCMSSPIGWHRTMRAALAIAERRIREDCAEIANYKGFEPQNLTARMYCNGRRDAATAILAITIP